MGRPRNGVPYLKGGVYNVRFKGDSMSTDLGTKSLGTAKIRVGEVIRMRAKRGIDSVASPVPVVQSVSTVPDNAGTGQGAPVFVGGNDNGPLEDWYRTESQFTTEPSGGTPSAPSEGGIPTPSTPPSEGSSGLTKIIDWEGTPGAGGLSSDEKMRLHGLLASVVGRLNVLGVGLGVRVFGRIPAEPETADMELLNKAWALQLNEMFADKEIKPAVLIAAASVGLGVGMWVNGEPKPPKVLPNE